MAQRDLQAHQPHTSQYSQDLIFRIGGIYTGTNPCESLNASRNLEKWSYFEKGYPFYGKELVINIDQYVYGELTQLLWKSTTRIGIGCAIGYDKEEYTNEQHQRRTYYVVANFQPSGNQVCFMFENF